MRDRAILLNFPGFLVKTRLSANRSAIFANSFFFGHEDSPVGANITADSKIEWKVAELLAGYNSSSDASTALDDAALSADSNFGNQTAVCPRDRIYNEGHP
jgi:hypothetical protein